MSAARTKAEPRSAPLISRSDPDQAKLVELALKDGQEGNLRVVQRFDKYALPEWMYKANAIMRGRGTPDNLYCAYVLVEDVTKRMPLEEFLHQFPLDEKPPYNEPANRFAEKTGPINPYINTI
jgi:hypothetical protein